MHWIASILLISLSMTSWAQNYYLQQIHTVEVPLSREQVWALWTTEQGVTRFFAPAARIGTGIGEPYEVLLDTSAAVGKQGNEGCVITQYQPVERLGFQWIAPPGFPEERAVPTEVFLLLEEPQPNWTKVTLGHIGWQEGGEWPAVFEYFEKAWPTVLEQFEETAYAQVLAPFAFLEGTWLAEATGTYESWTKQAKQMRGFGYQVSAAGDTLITERFTLTVSPAAIFFMPITEEESEEEPFVVANTGDQSVRLERPGEDFPQSITYSRSGNQLKATLEGQEKDQPKEIVIDFKKVD